MPTLNEFIADVLKKENIPGNIEEIANQIEDIARERAVNNIAAISDEEVRELVINNAELSVKLAEEKAKKEKREQEEREEKEKVREAEEEKKKKEKEAEKLQKKLEKERKLANGEQQSLFDDLWPSE